MTYICNICGEEKEEWEVFIYNNFIKCKNHSKDDLTKKDSKE